MYAIDILIKAIESKKDGGAYAIKNLISALTRSEKYSEAYSWFQKLLETSNKEYFNFVQMAYIANILGRKEDVATALYNACTLNISEPSIQLKGAAIKACLLVKDNDRAFALVKYFIKEIEPKFVIAGLSRPKIYAERCKSYNQMCEQYDKFYKTFDKRAALSYFEAVYSLRQKEFGASVDFRSVDAFFNACMFYGKS